MTNFLKKQKSTSSDDSNGIGQIMAKQAEKVAKAKH